MVNKLMKIFAKSKTDELGYQFEYYCEHSNGSLVANSPMTFSRIGFNTPSLNFGYSSPISHNFMIILKYASFMKYQQAMKTSAVNPSIFGNLPLAIFYKALWALF